MNDTEKAQAALAGITGENGTPANPDAQQNAGGGGDDLEKMRHAKDVWAGRAKQLQEEKKALEAELAKFKSGQAVSEAIKSLTPDERDDTPEEYLGASARVAAKIVGDAQTATNEEIKRLRDEMAAERNKTFLANIGQRHRELFASVEPGGDKHEYWKRFMDNHRETFEAVMANHDETRFDMLANDFYRELGIPVPGASASASLTPSTTGGALPAYDLRNIQTMTSEQYLAELEKAEDLRKAGDMKGWREINDRLKAVLNAGRVK